MSSGQYSPKDIIALQKDAKERYKRGLFVIEGRKIFDEISAQFPECVIAIFMTEGYRDDMYGNDDLPANAQVVSDIFMNRVSQTKTPQGILALVKLPVYGADIYERGDVKHLLILDDIRDPGNIGTILRTAEATGADAVILTDTSADIFNPKVVRSTVGSAMRVPFIYVDDMPTLAESLKKLGFVLVAADGGGTMDYRAAHIAGLEKSAIVIGNEANGISERMRDICDLTVRIPMLGRVESLNAAISAALMMYEWV